MVLRTFNTFVPRTTAIVDTVRLIDARILGSTKDTHLKTNRSIDELVIESISFPLLHARVYDHYYVNVLLKAVFKDFSLVGHLMKGYFR